MTGDTFLGSRYPLGRVEELPFLLEEKNSWARRPFPFHALPGPHGGPAPQLSGSHVIYLLGLVLFVWKICTPPWTVFPPGHCREQRNNFSEMLSPLRFVPTSEEFNAHY